MRCNTKDCPNYNIDIENNLTETGEYVVGYNKTCPLCKQDRVLNDKPVQPSFNIDEIALGTKRLHANKVKKYSH